MIELGIFIRLVRLVSFASGAVRMARAVPGTVSALILLLTAHAHKRHAAGPS